MNKRTLGWLTGIALLAVGVLTVHYTFGEGGAWQHHSEWAQAHGMPAPSFQLFVLGSAMTAAGGGWIGYLLGRRRRAL
jgi:hypothetical protein